MNNNTSTDSETLRALLEQFTKSLQVSVSLTQSVQTTQTEVTRQSILLGSMNTELLVMRDRVASLLSLVQGEGMGDSLYKSLIEIALRLKKLEKEEMEDKKIERENKLAHFPWKIAIWTIVAAFLTMIINVILSPVFNRMFK